MWLMNFARVMSRDFYENHTDGDRVIFVCFSKFD